MSWKTGAKFEFDRDFLVNDCYDYVFLLFDLAIHLIDDYVDDNYVRFSPEPYEGIFINDRSDICQMHYTIWILWKIWLFFTFQKSNFKNSNPEVREKLIISILTLKNQIVASILKINVNVFCIAGAFQWRKNIILNVPSR